MTVPSSTTRDQQTGNGATTAFTVPFRILDQTHLRVLLTVAGVTTEQTLTTHYSVSGVGDATCTCTFATAPASGSKITFLRNVPLTQDTDYVPNDPFPAESHERALDKLTMQVQQLDEANNRALTIPPEVSGVSTEMPAPAGGSLVGWNADGDELRNYALSDLATNITYGNKAYETFDGDGAETSFSLASDPGSLGNLAVSIDGVVQVPATDYTLEGQALVFTVAPASGAVILVRYDEALPTGATDPSAIDYSPASGVSTNVKAQLDAMLSKSGPDPSHIFKRDLVVEIGFFNATIDELRTTYNYNTMYPQGLCFDPVTDEMFVLRAGGVGGGDNVWAWFEVYDFGSATPKTIFTAEQNWRECVHVVYDGATRYLYSLDRSGNAYRIDITTLPANKAHVAVANTYAVGAQTQMCPIGTSGWAVMDSRSYWGRAQRNRFSRWSADMGTKLGEVVLDYDGAGTLSADVDEFFPKLQGICNHRGFYYGGMGGDFDESRDPVTMQNKHHGVTVFAPNGRLVAQGLTDPLLAKGIWQDVLGYEPSIVEVEAIAAHDDNVYMLWVTRLDNGSFEAIDGKGVVVTREMSSHPAAIDFSSAASGLYRGNDQVRRSVEVRYSGSQLKSPVDFVTDLDSFEDVIAYMRQAGLSRYAFFGVGQTMTDYNGASVASGTALFEFIALGDTTVHIRRTAPDRVVNWRITGIGTTPVQVSDDSGWIDATLQNSWVAFGGNRATPGYRKIANRVFLRGSAKSGSVTNGVTLFTLPSGYRPPFDVVVPLANGTSPTANTLALIDTTGLVRLFGPVDNVDMPIDGISFLTD